MIAFLRHPDRIRRVLFLAILFLLVGYQAINAFVPNAEMILAVRVLALGFYSSVLYVYAPDAWQALAGKSPDRSDFLVLGIWVSFCSHFGQSFYSVIYRLAPSQWLYNSEFLSFVVQFSIIASILHVSAPEALNGTVPRRNRIALGAGVGIATLLVGVIVVAQPNIRPFVDEMRPWIGDWWRTGITLGIQGRHA